MCTICDLRIEFSVDHPDGLSVAVETRRAIDAGLLSEPGGEDDALDGIRLRLDAVETLRAVRQRLEWTQRLEDFLALPDFFVLLIESRTWAFFRPTPSGFDPNCQVVPPNLSARDPRDRDAVLVSSELTMREIAAGRLSFDRALAEKLVILDTDPPRYASLLSTWNAAYPRVGFSRFVCA
ncbi:hypothetical protein [Rhodopila sp.]|uniref:hypothetical protein n=1 Tax=Rhodopila sp. TaxID=2480087 RepID=UPI002BF4A2BE|nr:hypothetical protein [Rhodopila sp.]HVZ07852.1 hypothetical protein [Rhodopila sp.]